MANDSPMSAIDWKRVPWGKLAEVLKILLEGLGQAQVEGAASHTGGDPVLQTVLRLQLESAQLLAERIAGK